MELGKKWYASRTVWVNIITLVSLIAASYGVDVPVEVAGAALVLINFGMRAITSEPLEK